MDRRKALKTLGAFAAGTAALGCTGGADSGGAGGRPEGEARESGNSSSPTSAGALGALGVQLYTLRSEMAEDVERTLERVAEIGYREVEFAGYFDRSPADLRSLLKRTGLRSPAAHVAPEFDDDAWARILERTAEVGHDYVVVAWIPVEMREDLDGWKRTAEIMNRAGEQARAAGLQYAYHNHDFEFTVMDGQVAFDVFLEATDPELVQIELDLFWITHGGGDPIAFLERWSDRVPLVHVKDRTPEGEMVDVGAGVIDWSAIFGHPDASGIRHYFVEHDRPEDAFASVRASYDYLNGLEF